MRPVPPCAAARRVRRAVPSAKASLQGSRVALSSTAGLRSVSTPAARTCRRPQPLWGRTRGAMTAALVIVPADPVSPSATAHSGRTAGSTVEPREVPAGAPWMVRLSMGSADVMLRVTSSARLAPARKHLPGSRR
jgi:hypothetical protein